MSNDSRLGHIVSILGLFLITFEGHCTSFKDFRTVKIQSSMQHFYWMNSIINVTCGMIGPAVKLEHCVWYVNDAKVSASERFHHQTSSVYEFSIEGTKCSVAVMASIADSGKWTCRVYSDGSAALNATTNVLILRLTEREFWISISGLLVCTILLGIIVCLTARTHCNAKECHRNTSSLGEMEPPTYESAVGINSLLMEPSAAVCDHINFTDSSK